LLDFGAKAQIGGRRLQTPVATCLRQIFIRSYCYTVWSAIGI